MNRLPKIFTFVATILWLSGISGMATADLQSASSSTVNIIQSGDVVEAKVVGYSEFNTKTAVSSEGSIIIPLVGNLQVAGLTEAEFQDVLRRSLSKFIKKEVTLITSITRTPPPSIPAKSEEVIRKVDQASTGNEHQMPQEIEAQSSSLAPRANPPAAQPELSVEDAYIIRPDDKISLDVWSYAEFNTKNALVNYNGKIDIPLIGDVQAAGLTEAQLQRQLRRDLARYIKGNVKLTTVITPAATAQAQNVVSINPDKTIAVMGAVGKQGNYKVDSQLPLLDVLSIAGGPVENSDMGNVTIVSLKRGRQEVNVEKILKKGNIRELPTVYPGDTIFVSTKKNRFRTYFTYFGTGITTLGTAVLLYIRLAPNNNN